MSAPDPFSYPAKPHGRRHGPRGYRSYESYRDWLRDEFAFRCIYCLRRERWGQVKGEFDIDHFEPQVRRGDLITEYDNLLYCCHTCNLAKGSRTVPDPHHHAYGNCLKVREDGGIEALNEQGEILIGELDLDAPTKVHWRRLWIRTVRVAWQSGDRAHLESVLGLPEDLPDLARQRPPDGNSRPEGLRDSWCVKQQRGELTDWLE
ncbi:MAG: HNH endonuclease [Akkermansiaceae bacterium]|nr:HNH endonuclease [Akkermansiaceae bacterium]